MDLNAHVSVEIHGSAAAIWPFILDSSMWKQGLVLVPVEGEVGERWTIHKAVDRQEMVTPYYYVQDVELYPKVRRTLKLYSTDGGALIGYASFLLEPKGRQLTRVSYHVYAEGSLPSEVAESRSEAEIAAFKAEYERKNRERFQAELESLKQIVEQNSDIRAPLE